LAASTTFFGPKPMLTRFGESFRGAAAVMGFASPSSIKPSTRIESSTE
jgi:hypothetical protein